MTPEDRALMTRAAKAIGLNVREDITYDAGLIVEDGVLWNPLENSADALKVAVIIHSYDAIAAGGKEVRTWSGSTTDEAIRKTRRAIVEAAVNYRGAI